MSETVVFLAGCYTRCPVLDGDVVVVVRCDVAETSISGTPFSKDRDGSYFTNLMLPFSISNVKMGVPIVNESDT